MILNDAEVANKNKSIENLKRMGAQAKAAIPALKWYHENLIKTNRATPDHTLFAMVAISPEDTGVQNLILNLVGGPDTALPHFNFRVTSRAQIIAQMHNLKIDNKQKYSALMSGLGASKVDRAVIINELAKLGTDAKGALPTLRTLKTDKEAAVRDAASAAIEAIKD